MSTPFIAEIKIISWNFAPKGWAFCNGQMLPINQNQALFSILGTCTAATVRRRLGCPISAAERRCTRGVEFTVGQSGGQEFHTVTAGETPAPHPSGERANGPRDGQHAPGELPRPTSNVPPYRGDTNTTFAPAMVSSVGGSQPHENRQPFLVLNFVIALIGIFPSRN